MFVVSKSGNKYRAVFQGDQIEVPMDAVEASDKRAAVQNGFGGGGDDDDDDDDFGGFEEAEEELAQREARLKVCVAVTVCVRVCVCAVSIAYSICCSLSIF